MKTCVFAGTFDPPTTGHERVVEECLKIFDGVTVALMVNTDKVSMFTKEERLDLLNELFKDKPAVKVIAFDGAVVDLLESENTPFFVRGVRDVIDFEYENRNFYASKRLMPGMVTIYLPSEQEELHVSSTLVRNSVRFKKDYAQLIPASIADKVKKLLENKDV